MSWTNPRPKPSAAPKVPSFDIPELCSSDSENLSPFLDVAEACLSPASPQAKRNSFSFSPVKSKRSLENALSKAEDSVVDIAQSRKQASQSSDSLGFKPETDKCENEDSGLKQLREKRGDRELEVIFAKDPDEESDLLTQIKDKRKELDDLINKWKNSRNPKAVIDLTVAAREGDDTATKDEKEMLNRSSEIVEVVETLEKQQECINIEETENTFTQSVIVSDNEKESREQVKDAVCVSESESEASSVEEVTDFNKPDEDVVEVKNTSVSNDELKLENTLSKDATAEVVEGKKSTDALQEIQTTVVADSTVDLEEDKNSSVCTVQNTVTITEEDQDSDHSETLKDAEKHIGTQDNEEMLIMEKDDSLEEMQVAMDVDEPVAGPSGLPVEWQGATVVSNDT